MKPANLNYHEKGQGYPLILIHGLSDDLHFWDPLIPGLAVHYQVISLDLRGHGQSPLTGDEYSIKQFAEDVIHLLDGLGIKKAHFIGFSLGGAIAQQLALDNPSRVLSLVLISSFSYTDSMLADKLLGLRCDALKGGFGQYFDSMVPLVLCPPVIQENHEVLRQLRAYKIEKESVDALIRSLDALQKFNIKNEISDLKKPVLVICGQEDALVSGALARKTHKLIENSQFHVLNGVGHNVLIGKAIKQVEALILEFLGELSPP